LQQGDITDAASVVLIYLYLALKERRTDRCPRA
jgi:hypothetical protein